MEKNTKKKGQTDSEDTAGIKWERGGDHLQDDTYV
jgi:hypothetical protein